jgi:putative endonuclease
VSSPSQADGGAWEVLAAKMLQNHGLRIVERSYRCRGGELDLICADREQLVIVEVRARGTMAHGGAAASVDLRKRRKIVLATRHFLMMHPQFADAPVRFDVVAIERKNDAEPLVRWIRNAFDAA